MTCERLFLLGEGGIGTTADDTAMGGRWSCGFAVSGGSAILAEKLH